MRRLLARGVSSAIRGRHHRWSREVAGLMFCVWKGLALFLAVASVHAWAVLWVMLASAGGLQHERGQR